MSTATLPNTHAFATPTVATQPDPAITGDTDALEALYNRSADSTTGYEKMVEKAEPSFRGTAEKFHALHARHAETLARLLAERGVEVNENGTLMGTLNKAVVSFRSFFDEIDEDVMEQVRNGEEWVLEAFDDAIVEHPTLEAKLSTMRDDILALLAETKHLDADTYTNT